MVIFYFYCNYLPLPKVLNLTHDRTPQRLIHKQRGVEALKSEASVLKAFRGTVVHDCWSPYFHFDAARHVLCGAHLLRELNNLMEQGTLWAGELHEFLLDLYRMPHSIAKSAEEVQKHYHIILSQAEREEPPPQPCKRESLSNPRVAIYLTDLKNTRMGYR